MAIRSRGMATRQFGWCLLSTAAWAGWATERRQAAGPAEGHRESEGSAAISPDLGCGGSGPPVVPCFATSAVVILC